MARSVALTELFLFRDLPVLQPLLAQAQTASFARREVICRPGQGQPALCALLEGRAQASPDGENAVLSRFAPGAVFGAASLFGGGDFVSVVTASEPCQVAFLPQELLERIFALCPEAAMRYVAFLSSRVRLLNDKLAVLTQNDTPGRLYRYLSQNGGYVSGSMTQLAATLNMGRTSLYRALETLEQHKLIVRRDKKHWEVLS